MGTIELALLDNVVTNAMLYTVWCETFIVGVKENFQQTRKYRALHVMQEAAAVEKAMNSNWTRLAWEKLTQFR